MNLPRRLWTWRSGLLAIVALLVAVRLGLAQDAGAQPTPPTAASPTDVAPPGAQPALATAAPSGQAAPTAQPAASGPYRQLAPGVMKSVVTDKRLSDTYSRHDVTELLAVDPQFDWAKNIRFQHDVWHLDFQFKPVRMMWIDLPRPNGYLERTRVWYIVYSVTNLGGAMHPAQQADGTWQAQAVNLPIRFVPELLLVSQELGKAYPDRVIPAAIGPISLREDPARQFLNSCSISDQEIQAGQTVWGVATWEGIDPNTDRFSIYVGGLTNAYRWIDEPGAYKQGDPLGTGRRMIRKTLKLNFWRPGDEHPKEEEIRFGAPGEVDYTWVYR